MNSVIDLDKPREISVTKDLHLYRSNPWSNCRRSNIPEYKQGIYAQNNPIILFFPKEPEYKEILSTGENIRDILSSLERRQEGRNVLPKYKSETINENKNKLDYKLNEFGITVIVKSLALSGVGLSIVGLIYIFVLTKTYIFMAPFIISLLFMLYTYNEYGKNHENFHSI